MSRSYKKHPYSGDGPHNKNHANRKVRRHLNNGGEMGNRCAYKKMYEQWDICDYYSKWSFARYKSYYVYDKETNLYYDVLYNGEVLGVYTEKQLYIEWFKSFKRK